MLVRTALAVLLAQQCAATLVATATDGVNTVIGTINPKMGTFNYFNSFNMAFQYWGDYSTINIATRDMWVIQLTGSGKAQLVKFNVAANKVLSFSIEPGC